MTSYIDDTPAQLDLLLYAGEAAKMVFELSVDLTGALVVFTVRNPIADEVILELTNNSGLNVIAGAISKISLEAFPRTSEAQILALTSKAHYDLQVTYPNNERWTYWRGKLELVKDVSRE